MTSTGRPITDCRPSIVIAIPARDEEERITRCLLAIAAQEGFDLAALGVVLFINNCADNTVSTVESMRKNLPYALRVVVRDDPSATAGWARRQAMDIAAGWLDEGAAFGGVLLTTDADSRVPRDWLRRNLAALGAGAAAVAGRLALDPGEAAQLPASLAKRGRLEACYEGLLTEIVSRLDPEPGDAWPTHWCSPGASIAVSLAAYRLVGGMPNVSSGEDCLFIDSLKRAGLVVRHDPSIVVETSARLLGRASGGVADTLRRRCEEPDSGCDDRLERVDRAVRRALASAAMRRRGRMRMVDSYRPVRPSQLRSQIAIATIGVCILRAVSRLSALPLMKSADFSFWTKLVRSRRRVLRAGDVRPR